MATTSNATTRTALFPPGFAAFLKRRAREAAGLAMIALAVALVLSMVSYHPQDPSLNTANVGPVHNWLGHPGALAGDLLLQTLGLSGGLLALVIAAWGYRILVGLGVARVVLRVALLPLGLLLGAMALAVATPPAGWPLVSGLGGFTGTLLLAKAGGLLPLLGASKPAITRRSVVLPQPDGPRRVDRDPSAICKDRSSTTVSAPKRLHRLES